MCHVVCAIAYKIKYLYKIISLTIVYGTSMLQHLFFSLSSGGEWGGGDYKVVCFAFCYKI